MFVFVFQGMTVMHIDEPFLTLGGVYVCYFRSRLLYFSGGSLSVLRRTELTKKIQSIMGQRAAHLACLPPVLLSAITVAFSLSAPYKPQ